MQGGEWEEGVILASRQILHGHAHHLLRDTAAPSATSRRLESEVLQHPLIHDTRVDMPPLLRQNNGQHGAEMTPKHVVPPTLHLPLDNPNVIPQLLLHPALHHPKHHARQLGEADGGADAGVDAVAVAGAGAAAALEVDGACKMRASRGLDWN